MTKIKIPTEAELKDRLAGLDKLLTAKRWERAAIIWAFTVNEGKGRPEKMPENGHFPVTMTTFAGLKFAGLSKRDTVARYRDAWQDAIDDGKAKEVHPGDEVELPDLPWPPQTDHHRYNHPGVDELIKQADEDNVGVTKVLDIAENPSAMMAAIKASPEVRRAAVEAIREHPATMQEISKAAIVEHPDAMREAIIENEDIRHTAFHAVQEGAELHFAGKGPKPDPDEREDTAQWNAMLVARRVNTGLTELIRLTRDLALTGDEFHQGLTHQVNNLKIKADALYSMVHDGAGFDAALQELLDSEK